MYCVPPTWAYLPSAMLVAAGANRDSREQHRNEYRLMNSNPECWRFCSNRDSREYGTGTGVRVYVLDHTQASSTSPQMSKNLDDRSPSPCILHNPAAVVLSE